MFSERMKELRQKHHMTQQQMAKYLSVSASTIGMYEQGRREPDTYLLRRLSSVFHVSTDYLLEVDNKPDNTELTVFLDQLTNRLWEMDCVTFHGRALGREERDRVITALKLSLRLALVQKD